MEFFIPNWLIVIVGYFLALVMSLRVVLQRREPTATLAWILSVILVPYLGVLAYLIFGRKRLDRQVRKKKAHRVLIENNLEQEFADDHLDAASERESFPELQPPEENLLARLSTRIGCRWPTTGNSVELLVDAEATYASIEAAIRSAKKHIHFQFYIFTPDNTGKRFRDLLIEKLKDGVAVRVLVDGVGSFHLEPFMKPFVEAGGEYAEFLPVGNISRIWHMNLRNHRKLVVVDGTIGFTGGVNIADEYTGRKKQVGFWRDTHIRIEGPAVRHLQEVFVEDWHFACGRKPKTNDWFVPVDTIGQERVHIIASGPDTDTQPIQRIFFAAVSSAKERVYLTTPYFIPDQAMLVALETAAMRGLDVRILLPHRSDAPLVLHAGRSYYQELIQSGVKIYEYQHGILHAKTMLVDDNWATVGSSNMDVRSFRLNFEINAIVYGKELNNQLAKVFRRDLRQSKTISLSDIENLSAGRRLAESFARILSPLL